MRGNFPTSVCGQPRTNVVFLKTYKTASTTVASILVRYGINRNLSFVLPSGHVGDWFSRTHRFNSKMVKSMLPPLPGTGYSMLVSHVPFNKTAIAEVIPNAIYITILRHPVDAFESIFGFFRIPRYLNISANTNQDPLEVFLSNPKKYIKRASDPYHKTLLRNRQIFDVGLDRDYNDNDIAIDTVIERAASEFDLVMIAEYFDESLVLLKKILCWSFDDIIYIKQNKRSDVLRFGLNDWKRQRILELNSADYKLYQHFNRTLWIKIESCGDEFNNDLAIFRSMLQKMHSECVDDDKHESDSNDRRAVTFLKDSAPSHCNVIKGNDDFTGIIARQNISFTSAKNQ
ncbi:galactosylceramide sulfotransferase-like [Saccoglossus kowalevskii]|uniref:Galactosylceramide sulfotransferase-like n=1 Tax=Saccoglossus kowalevskii TaxID=10224 RepID=A0ABM0GZS2_SACKO|nr:PREDICTED: galactosylceramide sulfotransferase-like [Saccoglossus kowalevskii]